MIDSFLDMMVAIDPDRQRVADLTVGIAQAFPGYTNAEVTMALCFHLNRLFENIPEGEARDSVLSGLMVMIDPPKGTA